MVSSRPRIEELESDQKKEKFSEKVTSLFLYKLERDVQEIGPRGLSNKPLAQTL
jgi:hypothetical protein